VYFFRGRSIANNDYENCAANSTANSKTRAVDGGAPQAVLPQAFSNNCPDVTVPFVVMVKDNNTANHDTEP
jgi:hypothetical protein